MRERESHENDTEVLHHARYPRANQSLGNDRALKEPAHWLDTVLKNNCNDHVCL